MNGMTNHIEAIRRMSRLASKTDVSLDELHDFNRDLGIDFFDGSWRERFRERNVSEEALKQYLEELCEEDIDRIHALMYSGRDNDSATGLKKHFNKIGNQNEKIRRILEKRSSLDLYLEKGLKLAIESGIDLERF